jgi:hypothetical protein
MDDPQLHIDEPQLHIDPPVNEDKKESKDNLVSTKFYEGCAICLEDYKHGDNIRVIHNCGHQFHEPCITSWISTGHNNCPLCKKPVV